MQQEPPKISVIMSVYNQWNKQQLQESISSVLAQTFSSFEFIIYNDGSDVQVTAELNRYAAMDSRIILLSNSRNHGLAYSLNTCIEAAKGSYLARMDDDDICSPDRFAIQYAFLEEHPEISFVGTAAKLLDESGVWGIRQMPPSPKARDFLRFSPFIHPSIMIRRSVFSQANPYQVDKTTWRCEDYELFLRLWRLGYQGYNLPQALLYYREDKSSYEKRKWKYRVAEMKLRYRSFYEQKILFPFGWWYVLRPMIAGLVPNKMILYCKRKYHQRHDRKEKEEIEAANRTDLFPVTKKLSDELEE